MTIWPLVVRIPLTLTCKRTWVGLAGSQLTAFAAVAESKTRHKTVIGQRSRFISIKS